MDGITPRALDHEADIQEILVRHYLGVDADRGVAVDESYVGSERPDTLKRGL